MFGFLAAAWAGLSTVIKATWDELAAAASISPFDAFMRANLNRWQDWKGPTQENPAGESVNALTVSAHTYTGSAGTATLSLTPSAATNIWGFVILRDTETITAPSWINAVGVVEADGANAITFVDSPLDAGTYHYRAAVMNDDGTIGAVLADATCVVT